MLQSFTSKLGQKPHMIDKPRLKDACCTAITGLQAILQFVNQLPISAGPPGLQTGINGLLFVLDAIQVGNLCSKTLPIFTSTSENGSKRK